MSALLSHGMGPWVPFQMLAAGWTGLLLGTAMMFPIVLAAMASTPYPARRNPRKATAVAAP